MKGGGSGASSVGYSVSTDNGDFAKVPAERFRRRWTGGREVMYYDGPQRGWVEAKIWGSQGTEEDTSGGTNFTNKYGSFLANTDKMGAPKEMEWVDLVTGQEASASNNKKVDGSQFTKEDHFVNFKTLNRELEFSLGGAVSGEKTMSTMSASSAQSTGTRGSQMAPVGATPLPSGAPVSGTPSPSLAQGETLGSPRYSEQGSNGNSNGNEPAPAATIEVIEPWTEVALAEVDGKKQEPPKYVPLWTIKAKPAEQSSAADKQYEQ